MKQLEPFTDREKDIMFLIAKRYTNQEIADELIISVNTVKWYARNIYSKLGLTADDDKRRATESFVQQNMQPYHSTILNGVTHHSLPFLGRENELEIIGEQIQTSNVRVVTLLAAGGMGKSRLALQLAHQSQACFVDGIIVIKLHQQIDDPGLLTKICREIGLWNHSQETSIRQTLLDYLQQKRCLLVIDNGEYMNASHAIMDLIDHTTHLTILIATRKRLGLSIETVHMLSGLTYPSTVCDVDFHTYPAIELLVNCVHRVQPKFELQADNMQPAYEIVKMTDGMPLAILMAASWAETMPLDKIAAQIQHSIDFLSSDLNDIPIRQRSIRIIFESLWDNLSPDQQEVFTRLSIFSGGFGLNAATDVAQTSLSTIRELTSKSLLFCDESGRLHIHELLRQFGKEKLHQLSNRVPTERRYISYFSDYVGQLKKALAGLRRMEAFYQIDNELDNIMTAWDLAIQRDTLNDLYQCIDAMLIYFLIRASTEERERIQTSLQSLLNNPPDHPIRASLLLWKNWSRVHSRGIEQIKQIRNELTHAARVASQHDKPLTQAYCEYRLGWLAQQEMNYANAIEHFSVAIDVAKQHGFHAITADSYVRRASSTLLAGIPVQPEDDFEKAMQLYKLADDRHGLLILYYLRGSYYKMIGQYELAEHMIDESIRLNQELEFSDGVLLLNARGHLYFLRGLFEQARQCADQATIRSKKGNARIFSVGTYLWGYLYCVEEKYARAYEIFNHLYHTRPNQNPYADASNAQALSLAYTGLGDAENARIMCAEALQFAVPRQLYGRVSWCLSIVAWLYAQQDQCERAITLLELARNHPRSASGWVKSWSLLVELRDTLQQEAGEKAYNTISSQIHRFDLMDIAESTLSFLTNT